MIQQSYTCSPPEADAQLWRYMRLDKYLSLLHKSSPFFARADKLGDPFEGSLTQSSIAARARHTRRTLSEDKWAEADAGEEEASREMRKLLAISCWHANERESAAMWSLYASRNAGIAIKTTAAKLIAVCHQTHDRIDVGHVRYIDYDRDHIDLDNLYWPFWHKHNSFEHEREVRALLFRPPPEKSIDAGVDVPVTLAEFLETVVISPLAPRWFLECLQGVTARLVPGIAVQASELAKPPQF